MFISFEGPEGSGKTTQIALLCDALKKQGHDILTTREPGGTPLADRLRSLLITRDGGDWEPVSEVLLLYAGRLEHVEKVIKPAIQKNKIVVSDRFADSTKAYQGYGRGLSLSNIETVESIAINDFKPDITLILDIDVKKGLERAGKRFEEQGDDSGSTEDKFERLDLSFHEKLRQGYLEIAQNNPDRCYVLNADQDIDALHQDIINTVFPLLEQRRNHVAS